MRSSRLATTAVASLLLSGCGEKRVPADAVFTSGIIYTLAGEPPASVESEPHVQAIALSAGRIVAMGTDAEIRKLVGAGTRVHDLQGRTAVPGLVDCHVHMQSLGRSLREVQLVGTRSYDEVIERVRARAQETPAGEWITGRGWDQNDWAEKEFPDHAALSRAVPDHPVFLRRVDGHAGLANAEALRRAGVSAGTPDPNGGRIVRRPDGSPAGVLVDRAMDQVSAQIPPPSEAERRSRLQLAVEHAAALGLTGVHDAGIGLDDLQDYTALLQEGKLGLRVYAMVGATQARPEDFRAFEAAGASSRTDPPARTILDLALRDGPQGWDPSMRFCLRTAKLMVDGALGSRGAALLEPYTDAPGERGLPQYTPAEFLDIARFFHRRGFQIATHAIGDAGNRMVLDAYDSLQREMPRPDARHRIEHAQVLAPEDIRRFAVSGVIPSMQPTHCTSDMPWAGARLGPERERGAYAWRSLRATGVVIAAGSDAPVESIDPLPGLYAAVTRQDASGWPEGGWHPEQRLTRSEALRAFTAWAAYSSFTEKDLGTLEPGKLADLTVFDRDVVRCEPRELLEAHPVMTVVGGEIVFEAAAH
jgi:predicted amidohydrolase YtcJ